jgi:hypothetical protein
MTSLEDGLLLGCEKLKNVKLPSVLVKIGQKSFSGCRRIKEILLPESLSIIGDYAFENCWSLHKLELPPYLYFIGRNIFEACHDIVFISPEYKKDEYKNLMSNYKKCIYDDKEYEVKLQKEEDDEGSGFVDYSDISFDDERY